MQNYPPKWSILLVGLVALVTAAQAAAPVDGSASQSIPALIDSSKYAEVLVRLDLKPQPGARSREVVAVHDGAWLHRFALHLRNSVEIKDAHWTAMAGDEPIEFVLSDGARLSLISVGEEVVWKTGKSQGTLKVAHSDGDALIEMIAAQRHTEQHQ
jgi:hypothetical protein